MERLQTSDCVLGREETDQARDCLTNHESSQMTMEAMTTIAR